VHVIRRERPVFHDPFVDAQAALEQLSED